MGLLNVNQHAEGGLIKFHSGDAIQRGHGLFGFLSRGFSKLLPKIFNASKTVAKKSVDVFWTIWRDRIMIVKVYLPFVERVIELLVISIK